MINYRYSQLFTDKHSPGCVPVARKYRPSQVLTCSTCTEFFPLPDNRLLRLLKLGGRSRTFFRRRPYCTERLKQLSPGPVCHPGDHTDRKPIFSEAHGVEAEGASTF